MPDSVIYRQRRYWKNGWHSWYEPCQVVKNTSKTITVESATYPESPLYKGGRFILNRSKLLKEGKVYHSRHGEWFYLNKPDLGFLFPSKDVLESPDPLMSEIESIGWDITSLTEDQEENVIAAIRMGISIHQAQTLKAIGEI